MVRTDHDFLINEPQVPTASDILIDRNRLGFGHITKKQKATPNGPWAGVGVDGASS
jgi:hypothetical protein